SRMEHAFRAGTRFWSSPRNKFRTRAKKGGATYSLRLREESSAYFWRRKASPVIARNDFLVRLVVIGEAEVLRVPAQFPARITGCFHRQQGRFGDPHPNVEWRP